jgi:hypothetical protein
MFAHMRGVARRLSLIAMLAACSGCEGEASPPGAPNAQAGAGFPTGGAAQGFDFAARGLQDSAFVMWTNHVSDGPSRSFKNVPVILWGNAGDYLKQGESVDAGSTGNNRLLNTLISATVQDSGSAVEDFGEGAGQLDAIRT